MAGRGRGRPPLPKPTQCETWGCTKPPRSRLTYTYDTALGGDKVTRWLCHAHWKKTKRERERADGIGSCTYVEGDYECQRPRATNRDPRKQHTGYCRMHEGFYLRDRAAAGRTADAQARRITVDTDTGCWVIPSKWKPDGTEVRAGTGRACGRSDWLVYRFLWHHFQEPREDERGHLTWGHQPGEILGHVCPVKSRGECVNPLHIYPLTEKENARQRHHPALDTFLGKISVIQEAGARPGLVDYAVRHGLDLYPSTGAGLDLLHEERDELFRDLLAPDNDERLAAGVSDEDAEIWAAEESTDWLHSRLSLRTYAATMTAPEDLPAH